MSIFKKKEESVGPIPVDENGNVVDEKEKGKGKEIAKKVLIGVGCLAVGTAIFLAVGVAMNNAGESLTETIDLNPDITPSV